MSIICFILSIICMIISILQFKEKGIVFNNAYLYVSEEERNRMNKKPYYRQSAIVFAFLTCIMAVLGIYCLIQSDWILFTIEILLVVLILYVIVSTVRITKKGK